MSHQAGLAAFTKRPDRRKHAEFGNAAEIEAVSECGSIVPYPTLTTIATLASAMCQLQFSPTFSGQAGRCGRAHTNLRQKSTRMGTGHIIANSNLSNNSTSTSQRFGDCAQW